jgi:hypothetical protein
MQYFTHQSKRNISGFCTDAVELKISTNFLEIKLEDNSWGYNQATDIKNL